MSPVSQPKYIFNELHFELLRMIAEGAMAFVYEAQQNRAGRFEQRVAVKRIQEADSKIEEFGCHVVGEARQVANRILTHSAQTHPIGQISGLLRTERCKPAAGSGQEGDESATGDTIYFRA